MVNRIVPIAGVELYKTYQLAQPVETHYRQATCAEIDCPNYLSGWKTILPADSPHVDLVRSLKGQYHFTENPQEGGLIEFVFPAGQPCFEQSRHVISLERPALYIVKGGDFRGNPTGEFRQHTRPAHWVEDFAEHQEKVAKD